MGDRYILEITCPGCGHKKDRRANICATCYGKLDHAKHLGDYAVLGATPWNRGLRGVQAGENHPNWKGGRDAYRARHAKQRAISNREYHSKHPEKRLEWQQRRRAAKLKSGGMGVTAKQWLELKENYSNLCAYCAEKKPLTMDHIIPLSKGGEHDIDNIVPACKSCNSGKIDKPLLLFMYYRAKKR